MERYQFFSVCIFNDNDQLYQMKNFDKFGDALGYAAEMVDKYSNDDEIIIYHNEVNSMWMQKGSKER